MGPKVGRGVGVDVAVWARTARLVPKPRITMIKTKMIIRYFLILVKFNT